MRQHSLQQTWVFSTYFYLQSLKNVNKNLKFLWLYTAGIIVEIDVKKINK